VALVGYTNAGKSTLFNKITGAEVLAKDMLFATLDPTMRAVELPSGRKIIASDTVGFISKLPTQLVAAFRATLEEVLEADLILHVRDISHPETAEQSSDVAEILASLGVKPDTPQFEVWNKLDLVDQSQREALLAQAQNRAHVFPISAVTGEGVEGVLQAISQAFEITKLRETLTLSFSQGRKHAWLYASELVVSEQQSETGWILEVEWSERQQAQFQAV
jgi:GTP-binding protein HflX